MFTRIGRLTTSHPWLVCAAWLAAGVALTLVAPRWDAKAVDDDINFLPARCDSVRGYNLLKAAFPQDVFASRAIVTVERDDRPLDAADFALIDRAVAAVDKLRADEPDLQLGRVYSHRDAFIGKRLVSADGHCSLIQVSLGTPFLAVQTRTTVDRAESAVRAAFAESGAGAPRLLVTGPAGVGRDLTKASGDSLDGTTIATVILVVVVLLLVYRAPLLALVPLLTIGVSVWVALQGLALMTLIPGVYLVNVSKVFAVVLLYGAGTDYCLFLISRYREELAEGHAGTSAIRRSVGHVGGALTASAGTVVWGLGLMVFAEFAKVRCAGPAIALSLVVALAASLTLTPAILALLGKVVFWPGKAPRRAARAAAPGFWDRVSRIVVARPAAVLVACLVVLAPLAVLGLRLKPNYKPMGELAPSADSIRGLDVVQRRFTAGETGPVTVLLTSSTDWNSPEGRRVVAHLSTGFGLTDNVAEVRSLTQPLGAPLPEIPKIQPPRQGKGLLGAFLKSVQKNIDTTRETAERNTREFYAAELPDAADGRKYVTRLDVVLKSDPFAPQSAATLDVVQRWLRDDLPRQAQAMGGAGAECYGVTVNARDLARVTENDRWRVNLLAVAGIFGILVVLVRRVWLAAYLLATVLFSYLATLGATALAGLVWSGRPLGEVDWRVPFFLFTILIAVGEDYNILIIDRALKERRKHGSQAGVRRALARTGGTITSCGLIMAGTFGTLMFAGLGTLVQCGFALAFGVLLDTFVVRPFLVPAFVLLVWRRKDEAAGEEETPPPAPRRAVRTAACGSRVAATEAGCQGAR
jgi:RND superfamily putative drug exporter